MQRWSYIHSSEVVSQILWYFTRQLNCCSAMKTCWPEGIWAEIKRFKNDTVFRTAETTGAGFIERLYQLPMIGSFTGISGKNLLEISTDNKHLLNPEAIPLVLKKMGISAAVFMQCVSSIKRNIDNDSGKPGDVNV